ncbi:hypothetical protein Ddye_011047 [Dipteronia dyeriana]|uniref:Uncharacterized protein n=1 Tax=Dipteronia dyeriana TaxID=168575 RepID=A0AAD9XES6_9ROSI|nr:hypothetical protein Ddye_011047 [Dipteronia dyeriana]
MKLSTKPISSPGRAEKYPPPLMRFLRSNVGSRSRGRSRSSPMFVLRKKSAAIETQEPTSPKVTCMGQVRVRRSKQQPGKKNGAPTRRRCKWMKNAWFCHYFNGRLKPRSFRPVWRKWVLFFRADFFRKSKIREDSSKTESKFSSNKTEDFVLGVNGHEVEEEEDAKVLVSPSSTPPRNALLLTRCRSAPYRSSSLASRFWGSPLSDEETESRTGRETRGGGEDNPTSRRESICRDSDQESIMDPESEEKMGFFKEFDGSINKIRERFVKSENTHEDDEGKTEEAVVSVRPLILTRCKSEPARTGQKLDPEISFWNKTRLGFT